jgi:hypothetical protein
MMNLKTIFGFVILGLTQFHVVIAQQTPVPEVRFNRDVRPILSDKCFFCHGFDAKTREANLRLDVREEAVQSNAFVPGKAIESALIERILSSDVDVVMPPPKSHKSLSEAEKQTLQRWIDQGAAYEKHWAFELPQRAPQPEVKSVDWIRNPIDKFILTGLEQAGLQPAPEASRQTLARRLSLDLTGLPPTPEQVEDFVNDTSPDAYERLVASLMATQRWGEHRGRYWLDAARYGDTHGIHHDAYREIWPYRDWVINAFNRNMPFDDFTIEQIAGDLLPNPSRDQLIATGFHRCNITTAEGGTIAEENLAMYANDRVTTTSWVWLGLTANCAACHDHKFDPITQKDFYSMAAYFRNTTQAAMDGNVKDTKPVIYLPKAEDEARHAELPSLILDVQGRLKSRRTAAIKDYESWLANLNPKSLKINAQGLVLRLPLDEGQGDLVSGVSDLNAITVQAQKPLVWGKRDKLSPALVVSSTTELELGNLANFDAKSPFSVGSWVKLPADLAKGTIVARLDDREGLQGWELFVQGKKFGLRIAAKEPVSEITVTSKKDSLVSNQWHHVLATFDGSAASSGMKLFLDGKEVESDRKGRPLEGKVTTEVAMQIGRRESSHHLEHGELQDVRVYARTLTQHDARSLHEERSLHEVVLLASDQRSAAQHKALEEYFFRSVDEATIQLTSSLEIMTAEEAAILARATVSHIQEEKPGQAMANILLRGAYDKLGEEVIPAGFGSLHPMPVDAPRNRLGLARWLMAPENPLTARVTVNRFWQELFGTGLVRTAEDFGSQGEPPANQALLDWLALEFRESGWNVKKLFTLMVTSATYRQASNFTHEKRNLDPQNRLVSRGPRFRMDAEMIRDYALAVSGTLSPKMGGPGTKPYQPSNIWEVVGLHGSRYTQDKGESLYRRTVYHFWKRQAPSPNMEVFNAPTREVCTVRRERTNTPLQALVTLNDPQFVEAARRLAELAMKENQDPSSIIGGMASRVLMRPLNQTEMGILLKTMNDLEAEFLAHPERATAFLSIGETKADATLPACKLATFGMIASQLLNLDEALNK